MRADLPTYCCGLFHISPRDENHDYPLLLRMNINQKVRFALIFSSVIVGGATGAMFGTSADDGKSGEDAGFMSGLLLGVMLSVIVTSPFMCFVRDTARYAYQSCNQPVGDEQRPFANNP